MIKFERQETRQVPYDVTIEEFMLCYFAEARLSYGNHGIVLIYIRGEVGIDWVFDVPMIEGFDHNNKDDVKKMIMCGYKNA